MNYTFDMKTAVMFTEISFSTEKSTEPNRQIPEIEPEKQQEKPTEPNPHIPERVPQRPLESPTTPNPHIPEVPVR